MSNNASTTAAAATAAVIVGASVLYAYSVAAESNTKCDSDADRRVTPEEVLDFAECWGFDGRWWYLRATATAAIITVTSNCNCSNHNSDEFSGCYIM